MPGTMSPAERKRRSRAASALVSASAIVQMYGEHAHLAVLLNRLSIEIASGQAQRTGFEVSR